MILVSSCGSSKDLQHTLKSCQNQKFWHDFLLFSYLLSIFNRKNAKKKRERENWITLNLVEIS